MALSGWQVNGTAPFVVKDEFSSQWKKHLQHLDMEAVFLMALILVLFFWVFGKPKVWLAFLAILFLFTIV